MREKEARAAREDRSCRKYPSDNTAFTRLRLLFCRCMGFLSDLRAAILIITSMCFPVGRK
jgi:hypothetical protein